MTPNQGGGQKGKTTVDYILRIQNIIKLELDQFIEEFTLVAHNLQDKPSKSYLCGDYNINLLKIDSSQHYNNNNNNNNKKKKNLYSYSKYT